MNYLKIMADRKTFRGIFSLMVLALLIMAACNKDNGDRQPLPPINITIDPNSTIYQELNITGGWMYLDQQDGAEPPSRGIIVYRMTEDQFLAFERTPPFKPDSCCNPAKTVCTALLVNPYPFIVDTCTLAKYSMLDGSPVSGPSNMPLSAYICEYYGGWLYIHD
jgi:hypothetical protein